MKKNVCLLLICLSFIIIYPKDIKNFKDYSIWLKNNFTYKADIEGKGYRKSPEETIKDKGGDCEDFAFLSTNILRLLGYESSMLNISFKINDNHIGHAISLLKRGSSYTFFSNTRYYSREYQGINDLLDTHYPNWVSASFCWNNSRCYWKRVNRKRSNEMKFKPMLAPNDQPNLNDIIYPILASYKLDGIRCIFCKGEMLSRSLKPIVNKQLKKKFEPLRAYTEKYNIILDGEIYSPELTFQAIIRYVMTQDFEDKKSIKKHGKVLEIPEHLKFYCFDCVGSNSLSESALDETFCSRSLGIILLGYAFSDIIEVVSHSNMKTKTDIENYFETALEKGYEGLILREHNGRYKCGRGTLKEGLIYKVKPWVTLDAQIIGVEQATVVDPKAPKTINELGRSVTSKKKGDRMLIEQASGFVVLYEGKELTVSLAGDKSKDIKNKMTNEEKEEIWKNREAYVGRWIEYIGMLVGAKDVPRHPTLVRFRKDKDY